MSIVWGHCHMDHAIIYLKVALVRSLVVCCADSRISNVVLGKAQRELCPDQILGDIASLSSFMGSIQNDSDNFTRSGTMSEFERESLPVEHFPRLTNEDGLHSIELCFSLICGQEFQASA